MKVRLTICFLISVLIMLGFPCLAVTLAPADAGMAICLLLFYIVNPIYSVALGCVAGKDIKKFWILPLISTVLFLIGVGIFFTMSEPLFFVYAGAYLVLGMVAMLIASRVNRGIHNKS